MQLSDLFWLGLMSLFALYWWNAQGSKHRALKAAKHHCQEMGVQMLDDSVVITRLRLARDSRGGFHWQRHYQFEFSSTYDDRYKGTIEFLGHRVSKIDLGIYRID